MRRISAFFLCCSMCLCQSAMAQDLMEHSEWGVAVGGMNYVGDLNGQRLDGKVGFAGALHYRYKLDDRWSVSLSAAMGSVEGGNPDRWSRRNLSFRSRMSELSMRLEFNFVPFGASGLRFRTSPFLFCGLGLFHFNPKAYYENPATGDAAWVELRPLCTEGQGNDAYPDRKQYMLTQMSMPFGMGFRFALSDAVTFSLEYGFRKTWTDYIDDVSTTYVGGDVLGAGTVAEALADRSSEVEPGFKNAVGSQRGDDSLNDAYAFFNVAVSVSMEAMFGWTRKKHCD